MDTVPKLSSNKGKGLEGFLYRKLNHTKNKLKHQDTAENEEISADFFFEAAGFISGAMDNYTALFGELPKNEEFDYFLSEIIKVEA